MKSAIDKKGKTRWLGRAVLLLGGSLLGFELALQLTSVFMPERVSGFPEGAKVRILCVGDSHTWGYGVPRNASYPAQLQRILDERSPGEYGVLNLGLPGMNTTQVRNRVPSWLDRYEPDFLIFWAGVNNAWNSAEMSVEGEGVLAWLDQQALRSRVYRFARTRLHDRALERAGTEWVKVLGGGRVRVSERADPALKGVVPQRDDALAGAGWERAERDLAAVAAVASAMDAQLLVVSYPLPIGHYGSANRVIDAVSERLSLEAIRGPAVLERVPVEERDWRWALHPGPRIYREVATELAGRVRELSRAK